MQPFAVYSASKNIDDSFHPVYVDQNSSAIFVSTLEFSKLGLLDANDRTYDVLTSIRDSRIPCDVFATQDPKMTRMYGCKQLILVQLDVVAQIVFPVREDLLQLVRRIQRNSCVLYTASTVSARLSPQEVLADCWERKSAYPGFEGLDELNSTNVSIMELEGAACTDCTPSHDTPAFTGMSDAIILRSADDNKWLSIMAGHTDLPEFSPMKSLPL